MRSQICKCSIAFDPVFLDELPTPVLMYPLTPLYSPIMYFYQASRKKCVIEKKIFLLRKHMLKMMGKKITKILPSMICWTSPTLTFISVDVSWPQRFRKLDDAADASSWRIWRPPWNPGSQTTGRKTWKSCGVYQEQTSKAGINRPSKAIMTVKWLLI